MLFHIILGIFLIQLSLCVEFINKDFQDERFKRAVFIKRSFNFTSNIKYFIAFKKQAHKILLSFEDLSLKTCLTFDKQNAEFKDIGLIFKTSDYNGVKYGNNKGEATIINLVPECISKIGCVKHHIGLALGLIPHQNRWDRNKYVNILYQNIDPKYKNEYKKISGYDVRIFNTPFDFGSIMNYETNYYSIDEKPTYSSKLNPVYNKMLGQRRVYSFNDIKLLNDFYCSNKCPTKVRGCMNGGYPDPNNCGVCRCPQGYRSKLCGIPEDSTGDCGPKKLVATKEFQTLNIKTPRICNHLIVSKPKTKVEVVVVKANTIKKRICPPGEGLEVKHRHNKGVVGLSFCGSYKNITVEPIFSQVLVRYHGTEDDTHFAEIKYREVN